MSAQPESAVDPRVVGLPRRLSAVRRHLPDDKRMRFNDLIDQAEVGSAEFDEIFSAYYAEANRYYVGSGSPQARAAGSHRPSTLYALPTLKAG